MLNLEKVILTRRSGNFTEVVLSKFFKKKTNLRHLKTVQDFLIRYDMISYAAWYIGMFIHLSSLPFSFWIKPCLADLLQVLEFTLPACHSNVGKFVTPSFAIWYENKVFSVAQMFGVHLQRPGPSPAWRCLAVLDPAAAGAASVPVAVWGWPSLCWRNKWSTVLLSLFASALRCGSSCSCCAASWAGSEQSSAGWCGHSEAMLVWLLNWNGLARSQPSMERASWHFHIHTVTSREQGCKK